MGQVIMVGFSNHNNHLAEHYDIGQQIIHIASGNICRITQLGLHTIRIDNNGCQTDVTYRQLLTDYRVKCKPHRLTAAELAHQRSMYDNAEARL